MSPGRFPEVLTSLPKQPLCSSDLSCHELVSCLTGRVLEILSEMSPATINDLRATLHFQVCAIREFEVIYSRIVRPHPLNMRQRR